VIGRRSHLRIRTSVVSAGESATTCAPVVEEAKSILVAIVG
jgi:hypothetical protein